MSASDALEPQNKLLYSLRLKKIKIGNLMRIIK